MNTHEVVQVTPLDTEGNSTSWLVSRADGGVILAPNTAEPATLETLGRFLGGASVAEILPISEELTLNDTNNLISASVYSTDTLVGRFYTDRSQEAPADYLGWLASNLMLAHALNTNPKYISTPGRGNLQLKPVQYFGAAIRRLSNGLYTSLTLMSRAPGRRIMDICADNDDSHETLSNVWGIPLPVLQNAVHASMDDSLSATYSDSETKVRIDPHSRNVIVDERRKKISVIDANGLHYGLSSRLPDLANLRITA